jgi:hypothetical protein
MFLPPYVPTLTRGAAGRPGKDLFHAEKKTGPAHGNRGGSLEAPRAGVGRKRDVVYDRRVQQWSFALFACACSTSAADVFVEVRTDYRGGIEFELVRVSLANAAGVERTVSAAASRAQDYTTGIRVAELDAVQPGAYVLTVELVSLEAVIAHAAVDVQVSGSRGMVVTITRDCATTTCSAAGTSCLNARCLADACLLGERPGCEPACSADGDCRAPVSCARMRCAGGVCLAVADDTACGGALCRLDRGCEGERDGGLTDAGRADGGFDAGADAGAPLDPDLVFWLPFDEDTGATRFVDATGHGHDASCPTDARCPASAAGPTGRALLFDGVDDGLVVPHHPDLEAPAFTVMSWARASNVDTGYRALVGKPFATAGRNSWELYFSGIRLIALANEMGGAASGVSPVNGEWFHAAVRWDGVQLRLFIDGRDRGAWPVSAIEHDVHGVYIGHDENSGVLTSHFGGELDDVRFYRRALTELEILDIIGAGP